MKYCVSVSCICFYLFFDIVQCQGASVAQHLLGLQKSKSYKDSIVHVLVLAKLYRECDAEKAVEYARKSISMAENAHDTLSMALGYQIFASTAIVHGDYPLGLKYHTKTIELLKNRQADEAKAVATESEAFKMNFANLNKRHDFENQQKLFLLSNHYYFRLAKHPEGMANTFYSVAQSYQHEADLFLSPEKYGPSPTQEPELKKTERILLLKKAEAYYQKSILEYQNAKVDYRAAACWVELAKIKLVLSDTAAATELLEKAVVTFRETNCLIGLGHAMLTFSTIYKSKGNNKLSLDYALQGASLFEQAKYKLELSMTMDYVSQLYEAKKDWQNVLKYRNLSWDYQKMSYNENKTNSSLDMINSYENRLKNEQILQLKAEKKVADLEQERAWYMVGGACVLVALMVVASVVVYRLKDKALKESQKNAELTTLLNKSLTQKAKEAELTALSAEMNPHFVFNVMASIQGLVLKNKQDEAVEYLNDFSRMSRHTLDFSRKKYIGIRQEIAFLKNYIALETLRFEDKFEVVWNIPETLDEEIETPPMLVQPILENAIQHGLMRKKEKGRLEIALSIDEEKQHLQFEITDNGVGRTPQPNAKHQSRATAIIQKRLELLTHEEEGIGTMHTIDLKDEQGQAIGTKVMILFSYQKQFWA